MQHEIQRQDRPGDWTVVRTLPLAKAQGYLACLQDNPPTKPTRIVQEHNSRVVAFFIGTAALDLAAGTAAQDTAAQ